MSDTPKRVRKFGATASDKSAKLPAKTTKPQVSKPADKAVALPITPPPKRPISILLPKKEEPASRFQNLLPDIDGITRDIIDSDLDHTKAVQIESKVDDMVDWAPNVISWCADRRFLDLRPFAKQAEILLNLYEEYCPRCSDLTYLADIPVADSVERIISKIAMLEFGVCPHCAFTKADGRASGRFVDPLELVAVIGQRAGKSALTGMAASYLVHRNAALTTPWKSYNLTPGQVIDFTIVATTVSQSEKTLWSTFSAMLKNSPWFKAYKSVCDEAGKKHGVKETVRATETFIWLDHKKMLIYFAANNPSSLRGTTRFGAAIDELGWFDSEQGSQKIRANGPETYSALNNACMTLRNAFDKDVVKNKGTTIPVPVMFNISSPRAMNDAIMTIYRDRAGDARTVRRHWATWEANPTFTQASLVRELAAPNGVRDFAAQPPLTDDPLIPRLHIVADAFKSSLAVDPNYGHIISPTVDGQIVDLEAPSGTGTAQFISADIEERPEPTPLPLTDELRAALGEWAAVYDEIMLRPPSRRAHVMGVDLGATTNALAVVCGYLVGNKFVTDFALEVKPTRNRSVNIAHVYEHLIVPLVERLNVVAVFYDRWSSLHQIQDLAARYGTLGPLNATNDRRKWLRTLVKEKSLPAFLADQYSLSVADALTLVSRLEQGDCLFPAMEVGMMELMINKKLDPTHYPFAHLALQMSTVRARGSRLLKPVGGDDDLFRAWANAAVKAFNDEMVVSLLKQEGPFHIKKRGKGMGPIGSYVSLGNPGKGIRRAENLNAGASSTSGPAGFAISVRKGTIRSM